jgi:peroxiredoxin Q/BCP
MTNELIVGQPAPAFSTIAVGGEYGNGTPLTLASLRGKTVVLYFYPKDDTPGCTTQACGIRDAHAKFTSHNIVVLGVSADSAEKHRKFAEKFALPFPLLSDESHDLIKAYGVWVEKSMYGKKYMGIERSTFVIGPDGLLKSIYRKVKPAEHAAQVLKDLGAS